MQQYQSDVDFKIAAATRYLLQNSLERFDGIEEVYGTGRPSGCPEWLGTQDIDQYRVSTQVEDNLYCDGHGLKMVTTGKPINIIALSIELNDKRGCKKHCL